MRSVTTIYKALAALVIAVMCSTPVHAQEGSQRDYESYPHWFVGLQGGVQSTINDYDFDKLITPIGAVSVGGYFTPVIGARVNFSGINSKGGLNGLGDYKYKYFTGNFDALFNLSNLLTGREHSVFNAVLVAGVGYNHSWDYKLPEQVDTRLFNQSSNSSHNFRMAMQFNFDVSKHIDLNIEGGANSLNDRFNGARRNHSDWQPYVMAGLAVKFGHKKREVVVEEPVAPVVEKKAEPKVEPKPVETPKPVVVETVKPKHDLTVFFTIGKSFIRKSEVTKVDDLVKFMKENPNARLTITGYADKGTGTAPVNERISRRRVESVAKALAERGIDASRIVTGYKGDTVQPFAENNKNRVVIGVAE